MFDTENGALIRVLSSASRAEISQVVLANDAFLLAFSVDGCVALWDWKAGTFIRIYRTKLPIHAAVVKVEGDDIVVFVASHRLKGVANGPTLPDPKRLFYYCAPKTVTLIYRIAFNLNTNIFKLTQLFKGRGLSRLALSPCGDELAFSSKAEVKIWRLSDQDFKLRTLQHSNIVSRLAYHPREPCLVLGDVLGRIVMWYCLNPVEGNEMPQRTLHWHANEVTDLAFCNEGQYLLSGGEESVMVLWQIESGLRQYLPRLGDPIHYISASPDDKLAAVSTRDNCIHLVSLAQGSSLQVQCSIKGVMKTGRLTGNICRLSADKPTLLLPGTPGKVQLFDPVKDTVCGGFELAPQNRKSNFTLTSADKHRPLEVALTAVSSCGRWMVSLEQRRGKDIKAAVLTARLKFWSLESVPGEATLLTVIDRPHRDLVTDLTIWIGLNGMPMAASSSLDGTFKIWSIDAKHGIWSCQHSGSYHDIGEGCMSVNVSPDAFLLATTFGPSVTLWSLVPHSFGHLVDVLTPSQASILKEARFVGTNGILMACREMGIFAFTRTSQESLFQLNWHAPVITRGSICVHPEISQFSLICSNPQDENRRSTCVLAYSIESPLPVGYHFALNSAAVDFVAVCYVASPENIRCHRGGEADKYLLSVFDIHGEFTLLGSESASRINRKDFIACIKPARLDRIEASNTKTKALYEAIFNQTQTLNSAQNEVQKHSMAELFAAVSQVPKEEVLLPLVASHVLPPMNMLFAHFIKNTVKKMD